MHCSLWAKVLLYRNWLAGEENVLRTAKVREGGEEGEERKKLKGTEFIAPLC